MTLRLTYLCVRPNSYFSASMVRESNEASQGVTYNTGVYGSVRMKGQIQTQNMGTSKLDFRILVHDASLVPKNMGAKLCL